MKVIYFALILLMINVCLGVKQCDFSRCTIGCSASRSVAQLTSTDADDLAYSVDSTAFSTCRTAVNAGGSTCNTFYAAGQLKCNNDQDINDAYKNCGTKCYGETQFTSQIYKDYASCMKGCYESGYLIKVCFVLLGFILALLI